MALSDSLRRTQRIEYPGSSTATVEYAWDHAGRLTSMSDGTGLTKYYYDKADRLTQVSYPNGQVLEYGYDGAGNRTAMGLSGTGSGGTGYQYDFGNRLTTITNPFGEVTNLQYDVLNRENYRQTANGVVTTREWDEIGRPTLVEHKLGSNVLSRYATG